MYNCAVYTLYTLRHHKGSHSYRRGTFSIGVKCDSSNLTAQLSSSNSTRTPSSLSFEVCSSVEPHHVWLAGCKRTALRNRGKSIIYDNIITYYGDSRSNKQEVSYITILYYTIYYTTETASRAHKRKNNHRMLISIWTGATTCFRTHRYTHT